MRDEILAYTEMCAREGLSLQRGMNLRPFPGISILLMSQRKGAPYDDVLSPDGSALFYEGHDALKAGNVNPKVVDQPWRTRGGTPTDNAKFADAVLHARHGQPALVRVYEKLKPGIWSDKGLFKLVDYEYSFKHQEGRNVFRFRLELSSDEAETAPPILLGDARRMIPGWVKQEVYKRDKGQCVICGATDQLHFDHELPFSKGGTSLLPENVRILCARHNLSKGAKIE